MDIRSGVGVEPRLFGVAWPSPHGVRSTVPRIGFRYILLLAEAPA